MSGSLLQINQGMICRSQRADESSAMHPHGAFSRLDGRRTAAKTPGAEALGVLVREAGLEPARPEWTLEPESSESANSTTRA